MGTVLNSLDNMIASARTNGPMARLICEHLTTGITGGTTSSGYTVGKRFTSNLVIPSVGGGLSGVYIPSLELHQSDAAITTAALEILLGTLTVSGNSYSHGSSMPTIADPGDPSQTITSAAMQVVAVVTTTLAATNPILTFNYTNQDGTTGRSGTITIPTNALSNSSFLVTPHLQNGDLGIRALSASGPNGLSISTGTTGVIKLYGLIPLGATPLPSVGMAGIDPLLVSTLLPKLSTGDSVGIYSWGNSTSSDLIALFCGVADN